MYKSISVIILLSVFVALPFVLVPASVDAGVPCTQNACEGQITGATCDCGTGSVANPGEYCLAGANDGAGASYSTKDTCDNALATASGSLPSSEFRLLSGGAEPRSGEDIINLIQRLANWIFAIFLALSIIYIVMAAFQFVTGGPEGVSDARQKLIFAVIGIGIGLIALGIPAIVRTIVSG